MRKPLVKRICSTRQKLLSNYSLALDLQSFYTCSERLPRDAQHQERITPVAAPPGRPLTSYAPRGRLSKEFTRNCPPGRRFV